MQSSCLTQSQVIWCQWWCQKSSDRGAGTSKRRAKISKNLVFKVHHSAKFIPKITQYFVTRELNASNGVVVPPGPTLALPIASFAIAFCWCGNVV